MYAAYTQLIKHDFATQDQSCNTLIASSNFAPMQPSVFSEPWKPFAFSHCKSA